MKMEILVTQMLQMIQENSYLSTILNTVLVFLLVFMHFKCSQLCLMVPLQFDIFARLITNLCCENSNPPSIHCVMLACFCSFCM